MGVLVGGHWVAPVEEKCGLIFDGRFCRMIFEELGGEPSVGMIHVT
jgi:hypothetical protein